MKEIIIFKGQYAELKQLITVFQGKTQFEIEKPTFNNDGVYAVDPGAILSLAIAIVGPSGLIATLVKLFDKDEESAGRKTKCKIIKKREKTVYEFKNLTGEEIVSIIDAVNNDDT